MKYPSVMYMAARLHFEVFCINTFNPLPPPNQLNQITVTETLTPLLSSTLHPSPFLDQAISPSSDTRHVLPFGETAYRISPLSIIKGKK